MPAEGCVLSVRDDVLCWLHDANHSAPSSSKTPYRFDATAHRADACGLGRQLSADHPAFGYEFEREGVRVFRYGFNKRLAFHGLRDNKQLQKVVREDLPNCRLSNSDNEVDHGFSRPIWTGTISFGLVNIPIRLFTAVREHRISFHMLHDQDNVRLRRKLVARRQQGSTSRAHREGLRGHKDQYVIVQPEDLEACSPEKTNIDRHH